MYEVLVVSRYLHPKEPLEIYGMGVVCPAQSTYAVAFTSVSHNSWNASAISIRYSQASDSREIDFFVPTTTGILIWRRQKWHMSCKYLVDTRGAIVKTRI